MCRTEAVLADSTQLPKQKWEIYAKHALTDKETSSQDSAGDRPKSFS